MNITNWLKSNTSSLKGLTIAITGSTGALISSVIKKLATLGANFIFLNRSKNKTEKQIQELKNTHPNINAEFIECDLANHETVKATTKILQTKKFDVLYFAAGVYNVPRFKTNIGFDNVFQTNFVSNYYMLKQLSDKIKKDNIKILAISSIAHNYSKLDENDVDFSNRNKHSKVYGNSKRFLTFALHEFCKKENINLSIVHPGVTLTEMTNHYPKCVNWLVKIFIKLFCPSVEKASLSLIKGLFETTNFHEWIGPSFCNVWGYPKQTKLKTCSLSESENIFKIAENIYNNLT